MTMATFMEMAGEKRRSKMGLCVGIDPVKDKLPPGVEINRFITGLVEATAPYAAAFKPNIAFFERMNAASWLNYQLTITAIRRVAPFTPIIGDAKRGDIGATNLGYIESLFDDFGVDAVTVHNYLGRESLQNFLDRKEKGIIVLCRTSNSGAGEFQDLLVDVSSRPILGQNMAPLYQKVANNVFRDWNTNRNCGLVVGATYPTEIGLVRQIAPSIFILIPGVGTSRRGFGCRCA